MQMMEDKQNILKSFEGKKIDESVHVARWGTVNNEDSNRNIFQKYAAGSSNTLQQQNLSQIHRHQNTYNTQQSQVHQIDTGFKRLKNNQIQMLKDLKSQYDVLRNLNIEQKPAVSKKAQKLQSSSSRNNINDQSEDILSSSSHQSKQKIGRKQNTTRQAQILALEKRQLQMVINNSMRKIQQLLHSEMQYKKQIHQLKLQVSGRQNTDIEYESMLKTLKKSQINQHETIQSLKKEHEKSKYQIRQLNQKISSLEGQFMVKEQEIRRLFQQKRKSQDLIRLQKDRYFNIDIDYKKIKMEYELLQKDKNSQINRLSRQIDSSSGNKVRQLQNKVKRYQEDLDIKDKRYHTLLNQLQEMKRKFSQQEIEINQLKTNQSSHVLDKQRIEDILTDFRDQNDSVSFNRNMNEVLERLHDIDNNQNQFLRQQMELLKLQIQQLKDNERQPNAFNVQQYVERIDQLERNLRNQSSQKNQIIDRLKRFQRDYEQIMRKNSKYQKDIQQYQNLQSKLRQQIRNIKLKMAQNAPATVNFRQSKFSQVQKLQQLKQVKVTRQVQILQKQLNQTINKYRNKVGQLQDQLRATKRVADENDFKSTKATTQMEFRLRMQQNQNNSMISRIGQDLQRQRRDSVALKQQYQQYKVTVQRKLAQRQKQIESLKIILRSNGDQTQSNVSNIKLQYESLLKTQRERYRMQVELLTTQVTSLSKINEKYLQETNKYVHYENQLSCLRQIMKRSIHLSQGVDHLWRIKQTEYQNVNQILRQISNWQY